MTVAYVNNGTAGVLAAGTLTAVTPNGTAPGDLLLAILATKYSPTFPDTPAGWTLLARETGGAGASGVDSGLVTVSVYYRISDGTDTSVNVVWNHAGDSGRVVLFRYSKDTRAAWDIAATTGQQNTATTAWSVTGGADPGFAVGDMAIACSAINSDSYGYSAEALAASGATFANMVERNDSQTTTGDDAAIVVAEFDVTAGPSSDAPTYTMTGAGSTASTPAGATVIVRLREVLTAPILYNNQGSNATGTTSISVASVGSTTAGEPLLLIVTGKYPTNYPSTPSGWTHLYTQRSNSGAGAGVDAGDTWCAAYYRAAPGGTVTFTLTVTGGNSISAVVYRNLITSGYGFSAVAVGASMDTPGTAVSLTFADPGIEKDDLLYLAACENVDTATLSGVLVSVPGAICPLINRDSVAVTAGDDHRRIVYSLPVNSVGAGGSVVATWTASAAVAVSGLLIRLRGIPPTTYLRRGLGDGLSTGIQRGVAGGICAPPAPAIERVPLIVAPPRRRRRPLQETYECRI